ncbi:MAG TPA: hypothetical protein VFC58_07600 [Desulfosporosinus sp.]|nr:hypothetical protein [Desulfosporosinus sp.]
MYGMNQGMNYGQMYQGGVGRACCHPPVYAQPIAQVGGGIGVGVIAVAILILIALGLIF